MLLLQLLLGDFFSRCSSAPGNILFKVDVLRIRIIFLFVSLLFIVKMTRKRCSMHVWWLSCAVSHFSPGLPPFYSLIALINLLWSLIVLLPPNFIALYSRLFRAPHCPNNAISSSLFLHYWNHIYYVPWSVKLASHSILRYSFEELWMLTNEWEINLEYHVDILFETLFCKNVWLLFSSIAFGEQRANNFKSVHELMLSMSHSQNSLSLDCFGLNVNVSGILYNVCPNRDVKLQCNLKSWGSGGFLSVLSVSFWWCSDIISAVSLQFMWCGQWMKMINWQRIFFYELFTLLL